MKRKLGEYLLVIHFFWKKGVNLSEVKKGLVAKKVKDNITFHLTFWSV